MRSRYIKHCTIEELHTEKGTIAPYWKTIAHIASWMLLAGFLLLPTTFENDPQLRMTDGVIIIIIVAFLTGGYSLTVLLWFACPSILFRIESIFVPAASCSFFGFLATAWRLATSPRYDASKISGPITIVLTLISAAIYGALGILTHSRIKQITSISTFPPPGHASWQHDSGQYAPYASSLHPLTAPSIYSHHSHRESIGYNIPQAPAMTEDEMVAQQMAGLLTKANAGSSPEANQSTFRLEWPMTEDEEDLRRTSTFPIIGANVTQKKDTGVTGAFTRISKAIGLDQGRAQAREEALAQRRARSREDRRREIELGHIS